MDSSAITALLVALLISGVVTGVIARFKNRSYYGWLAIGLLTGVDRNCRSVDLAERGSTTAASDTQGVPVRDATPFKMCRRRTLRMSAGSASR
jgi:hypothetical protein